MEKKKLRARCGPVFGLMVEPELRHREATPQEQAALFSLLNRMGFDAGMLDVTAGSQNMAQDHALHADGRVNAVSNDPRFDIDPAKAFIGYAAVHQHQHQEQRKRRAFSFGQSTVTRDRTSVTQQSPRRMAS